MFSDGIRPGGDLTELDQSPERRRTRRSKSNGHKKSRSSKHHVSHGPVGGSDLAKSLIPHAGMPMVSGDGHLEDSIVSKYLMEGQCLCFVLNKNLKVYVKQLHCKVLQKFSVHKNLREINFILQMLQCQITCGISELVV